MKLPAIDKERLTHGIKAVVACLVGLFFGRFIGFSSGGQWVVITIIVVMTAQLYVGSVIQRSYLRFLGTILGLVFTTFTLIVFGPTYPSIAITICVAILFFSYISAGKENLAYMGTLGAVTTAIILLTPHITLWLAFERFLEISLGILVASITSQFVMPIHASTHLRRTQVKTLELLRDRYKCSMAGEPEKIPDISFEEMDENIALTLIKQRQLAKEARREPFGEIFDAKFFMQCLYLEREIFRSIDFMHSALLKIKNFSPFFKAARTQEFNEKIIEAFDLLIKTIDGEEVKTQINIPSAYGLKKEIELINLNPEELIYCDTFLFCTETLVNSLRSLAKLYKVGPDLNGS